MSALTQPRISRPRRIALRPRIAPAIVALALVLGSAGVALAPAVTFAASATFGTPTASSTFGKEVVFDQPVDLSARPDRVEVLLTSPGALGPNVAQVAPPSGAGSQTLHYALEIADGHIFPNTKLTVQWRLTFGTTTETGPATSILYADTRFDWKTKVAPSSVFTGTTAAMPSGPGHSPSPRKASRRPKGPSG